MVIIIMINIFMDNLTIVNPIISIEIIIFSIITEKIYHKD